MTTDMNIEQERAAFEAWAKGHYILQRSAYNDTYIAVPTIRAWEVWQARAALQSPEIQALRKDAEAFRTMVSKRLTVCVRELGHEVEVFRDGECLSWPACGAHANDKERTAVARQAIVMAVAAMEQQK